MFIHLPGAGALTRALCMTLMHSLWQGLLVSVLAGFFIAATRRSRAAIRYNLLTLVVVLFLLAVGATFFRELGSGHILPVSVTGTAHNTTVVRALAGLTAGHTSVRNLHPASLLVRAGRFLNAHAATVVLIWMLCLLVQLVRMAGGLYQMGKLRTSRVFLPSEEWTSRLGVLARRLGITREIALLQSALVKIPSTFGFWKPSILVPLGMLANLPPDQVETILLHELAHIRRNDYIMNLGLHLLDATFFFNPGIRWIVARLREEREACCDDMVLGGVHDRNSYLDALVAFRENAVGHGQGYALSLGAGKTDLLWRIRRMLDHENKKLHIMEKAILSIGLSVILAIGLLSMWNGDKHTHKTGRTAIASFVAQPATDTLPGTTTIQKAKFPTINTSIDDNGSTRKTKINATDAEGNTFELTKVNDQTTSLTINGKSIPKGSFDQYMYIFDEIGRRSHANEERERHEIFDRLHEETQVKAERDQEEALWKAERMQQEVQEKMERQQEDVQRKAEQAQEAVQQKVEQAQEAAQQKAEQAQEAVQQKAEHAQEEAQAKAERDQQKAEMALEESEKQMERNQEEARAKIETLLKTQVDLQEATDKHFNADHMARQIIHDLIDKGILTEKKDLTFKLDSKELVVNGTKQPEETFQFFKNKYIKSPKDHFVYKHTANGTNYDVWVE
jgi:bla regulator protein blaR1